MEKIYSKVKKKRTDTVYNFILNNYAKYNCVETFKDKECTNIECFGGKNRSLDALYALCLSKFPNLSTNTFFKNIYSVVVNHKIESRKPFALLFCTDISKWVLYKSNHFPSGDLYYGGLVYDYCESINKLDLVGKGTFCCRDVIDAVGVS